MEERKCDFSDSLNNENTADSTSPKRKTINKKTESTGFSKKKVNLTTSKVDNNVQAPDDSKKNNRQRQKENRSDNVKYKQDFYKKKSSQLNEQRKSNDRKFEQPCSNNNKKKYFNSTSLNELSKKDDNEILTIVAQKQEEFIELLRDSKQLLTVPNNLVLVLKILTKLSQANFTETVINILSHACSNDFLKSLETYISKLPFEDSLDKLKNTMYHKDKDEFWLNVIKFFEKMIELIPTKTRDELPFILQKISVISDHIAINQDYKIDKKIKIDAEKMLNEFKDEIGKIEKKLIDCINKPKKSDDEDDPPEDFRLLNVMPTLRDFHDEKVFIRACKVKDAYDSVEQYLDIQFRLLREDFMVPLRNGIQEYLRRPNMYGNPDLRVYKNVKMIAPIVSQFHVGVKVFFGKMKNINWHISKRFLPGGLVLLSNDNYKTVLFATILDRYVKDLEKGFVVIEPCVGTRITGVMYRSEFVMLESKIFFEPYLAVLSALKYINERNFPMEKYLIHNDSSSRMPNYLVKKRAIVYVSRDWDDYDLVDDYINNDYSDDDYNISRIFQWNCCMELSLNVSGSYDNWPSAKKLGYDESQRNALKCALTQEFAIIQGPPGTGKTFIALEIIRTLLINKYCWKHYGPILIVCLTNHALDQFLEGILNYTDSVVRMGSRSKNPNLKQYTLVERRKEYNNKRKWSACRLMYQIQDELKIILDRLEHKRSIITSMTSQNFIVSWSILRYYCKSSELFIQDNYLWSDLCFFNWLIGVDPFHDNPLLRQLIFMPIRCSKRLEDIEQEYDMDDELNFRNNFNDTLHGISIIKNIDIKMRKIYHQLQIDYRVLEANALPYDPLFDHILECEETYKYLAGLRSFLQNEFTCHPLLNLTKQKTSNPNWQKYWTWIEYTYNQVMTEMIDLESVYRQKLLELNEARQMANVETLKEQDIIGLTTNGAARIQSALSALHAPIVLVEEAAEVLESHVVCSLTKSTQHVILIGDHKQLRPKASTYELGKNFNLNVSLFERMVNIRGESDCQLTHQHRMRPEIAKLIHPTIYKVLYNTDKVHKYPNVKGLVKNLYFIDHNNHETNQENDDSYFNEYEAKFLIEFAKYLLKQAYDPTDITILCTYSGQLLTLMKEAARHVMLKNVNITTVDNFQGEESKIILLSLVRNNDNGNIGFLKEENRVCVALSRAREGLYIMGNMDDLIVKNNIWPKIKKELESQNAIGTNLEAQCQIHTDQITQMKAIKDFAKCPEGGCLKICDESLACGHSCAKFCHILDREHEEYKCKEKCTRKCKNDHSCSLDCYETCKPCVVMVERELKCGHTVQMLCHEDNDDFHCYIEVNAILSDCNHNIKKPCWKPIEACKCTHPCENHLSCGHACELKCHVNDDPDHADYKCNKICGKSYPGCEHTCQKKCFMECGSCDAIVEKIRSCGHYYKERKCPENIEDLRCLRPCKKKIESCGHECKLLCSEICGNCQEKVKKLCSCGHELEVKCSDKPDQSKCNNKCQKILPCEHPCMKKCKERCTTICKSMVVLKKPGLCGHVFKVPCYLDKDEPNFSELLKYCKEPCQTQLSCGHLCSGTCGQCKQGRFHIPCTSHCTKTLICGHKCKQPCKKECQPCNERCEYKCPHTKCNKKCGIPCTPCKKPCLRGCEHQKCKMQCHELCDVDPCNKSCKKMLKCGHPCLGFCGDICPPICKDCATGDLSFHYENNPDARFVFLENCGHCIESKELENWLMQSSQLIGLKTCPRCKTPIIKCKRIMNTIKKDLKDLASMKNNVYFNSPVVLRYKQNQCLESLKFMRKNTNLIEFPELEMLMQKLPTGNSEKNKKRYFNAQEIEALTIILSLLKQICDVLRLIEKCPLDFYKTIKNQIKFLAEVFPTKLQITDQELDDIQLEIRRLQYMVNILEIDIKNIASSSSLNFKNVYEELIIKILSIKRFTENLEKEIRHEIKELVKTDPTIESKIIVKSLRYNYGFWYKCSNGHYFTSENSKCDECN